MTSNENQLFWRKKRLIDFLNSMAKNAVYKTNKEEIGSMIDAINDHIDNETLLKRYFNALFEKKNLPDCALLKGLIFIINQHQKEAALLEVIQNQPSLNINDRTSLQQLILEHVHHSEHLEQTLTSMCGKVNCATSVKNTCIELIRLIQLYRNLKKYFGYDFFKSGQLEVVSAILKKLDALIVMPTSGGKSLCIQFPTLVMGATCIIISSLLALTDDQIANLSRNASIYTCRVGRFDSSVTNQEKDEMLRRVQSSKAPVYDFIYVTPESFIMDRFQRIVSAMVDAQGVSHVIIAVDEAHLLKHWGGSADSIRPEMLQIGNIKQRYPSIQVIAATATADTPTKDFILKTLNIDKPTTFKIIMPFNRPNVTPFFISCNVEEAHVRIISFIKSYEESHNGACPRCIVYRDEQGQCNESVKILEKAKILSLPYFGGPMTQAKRDTYRNWVDARHPLKVVCATIAFGMGVDAAVHFSFIIVDAPLKNMPSTLVQEIGRAGRDTRGSVPQQSYGYVFIDFKKCFVSHWKIGGPSFKKKRTREEANEEETCMTGEQRAKKEKYDAAVKEFNILTSMKVPDKKLTQQEFEKEMFKKCRRRTLISFFSWEEAASISCLSGENVNFAPCDRCAIIKEKRLVEK